MSTPFVEACPEAVLRWLRSTIEGMSVPQPKSKPDRETVDQRLARLRRTAGLTQQQLADKTGISRRMIAHYETQATSPPAQALPLLAKALGVTVDEILATSRSRSASLQAAPQSTVDLRLWRKLQQLQQLSPQKRRAVLQVLDGYLSANSKSAVGR
jgi:transcriptional regulator with XRE-family HTH domain